MGMSDRFLGWPAGPGGMLMGHGHLAGMPMMMAHGHHPQHDPMLMNQMSHMAMLGPQMMFPGMPMMAAPGQPGSIGAAGMDKRSKKEDKGKKKKKSKDKEKDKEK